MSRGRGLIATVMAAVITVVALAGPAGADDLDNQRKQKQNQLEAAETQKEQLAAQLEDLEGAVAETGQRLADLQAQLPAAQAAVDSAKAELVKTQREADLVAARLADAEQEQSDLTASIEADNERADELHAAIAQIGREAYRGGAELSGLEVVLESTSTEDFVEGYSQMSTALRVQTNALAELDEITANNKTSNNRLIAVTGKISELKAEADEKVAEAAAAKKVADDAKATLDTLTAKVGSEQASLEAQQSDVEAQLAAADASRQQLANELSAIIAQQRATGAPSSNVAVAGAVFANPTAHNPIVVTSEYGMRWQPVLHIYRMHAGIDLRAYCGEPIYATRSGTVQWTQYRAGYGNQIMVDHGWVNGSSLMSSYSHLSKMVVSSGQHVATGDVVGYSGATGGISTGCHLHFETYINGATVNPRSYLGL